MDGYELAARFSYITNALRYCGPDVHKEFLEYIEHPEKRTGALRKKIRGAIKKFESLHTYLEAIAAKHNKDFLDYDVVEAYWLGNRLLDSFNDDDIKKIILKLVEKGLPSRMADKLIRKLPTGFKPSHNFHVLYLGVGNVAGTVKTTLQTMDNCRISSGKVVDAVDDKIFLETTALVERNGRLVLEKDTKTAVLPPIIENVKIGDLVAMHWGFVCTKLKPPQAEKLEKYMKHSLEIRNKTMKNEVS